MAMLLQNFAFGCILLLSIQHVALAVTCYSCALCNTVSTSTDTDTGDYCYTATGTVGGQTVVYRDAASTCLSGSTTYGGVTGTFACCSTDRCNSSIALSSSLSFAFILVIAVIASKWIMNN